jgi:hypothetical protein
MKNSCIVTRPYAEVGFLSTFYRSDCINRASVYQT